MFMLVCAAALPHSAQAQWRADQPLSQAGKEASTTVIVTPRVRAELVAHAPQGIHAGADIQLGLLIAHEPGWHTYWRNPGDSGMATELHWQLPDGLTAGAIAWPTPMKLRIGELANYGYEGRLLLPVPVTVAPDWAPPATGLFGSLASAINVQLEATWLVCKLECIPEHGRFSLAIPITGSTGLFAADFHQALLDQPVDWPAPGSQAAAAGDRLQLRLNGLPSHLRGELLELFVEAPFVIDHGARFGTAWQQHWDGDAWVADVPLAQDRQPSRETLGIVVTRLSHSEGGQWDPMAPRPTTLISSTQADANDAQAARGWRIAVPVTAGWEGAARAQPSPELLRALADNQASAAAAPAIAPPPTAWSVARWAWLLALALLGGALLNLMPCVFPVLAIKALAVARYGGSRQLQRQSAWAYGAGVVASFAALGGLVLALRAAGLQLGWGFQLQSPWFVAALALLFTLMGLALAGVVGTRLWLPAGVRSGAAATREGSPVTQAFATGVLAVLVASPCTGPFMGAALGATLSLPAAAALAVFVAMGVGLALPFMLLVRFPGLLESLPRPGAWMETFRTAMAFPMFATVAWLLWVLAHQVGINGMAAWLFALWALSFALWVAAKRPAPARGVPLQAAWAVALLLPLAVAVTGSQYFARAAVAPPPAAPTASVANGWGEWSALAQQQALQAGQPVFVDFTASWCITCQYNKMTTLADDAVLAAFNAANVQLLRADWTRQNPAITAELTALGRSGVPTYALHVPGQPVRVMAEILDKDELQAQLASLSVER